MTSLPVFLLLYTSKSSSKQMTPNLIEEILHSSRRNNGRENITGFLVARDGYFLQLLEGDESKVRACFERIAKDPRHSLITIQGETRSEKRLMPDWSMALVDLDSNKSGSAALLKLFELGRAGEKYASVESFETVLRLFSEGAKVIE